MTNNIEKAIVKMGDIGYNGKDNKICDKVHLREQVYLVMWGAANSTHHTE